MESQFKKVRPSIHESKNIEELKEHRTIQSLISGKHIGDIIKRERTKHLSQMLGANTLLMRVPLIWIHRIGPDNLVENRPAWVEFTVWNFGDTLTDVFVRARIEPRQSVTSNAGAFEFSIKKLDHGQSLEGAISFQLPRADFKNIVTVELCKWRELQEGEEIPQVVVLGSDNSEFDVAARFSIHMQGIWIRETASHHEDTVFVALNGQFGNTSWGDAVSIGDHNNTESRGGLQPNVMPVGPFDMFPGSGSSIAISCVIANAGHTSSEEDAKKALKIVSVTGATVATVVMSIVFPVGAGVWAGLSAAINELNSAIIDWALADCDTVVLNDGKLINEQDLFLFTFDAKDSKIEAYPASWVIRSQKKAGDIIVDPQWLGGGCRDSDYTTTLSLERHRMPEMIHDYNADGVRLGQSQIVNFGLVDPSGNPIIFDLEGNGKIQPDGQFSAPLGTTDRKFTIVKWTVFQQNKKGIFPYYQDFTIVLLD